MDDRRHETPSDALSEAARALPRELPPRRDLWPGLRAALEREPAPDTIEVWRPTSGGGRSAAWLGWLTAAAAAALIVVGIARMGAGPSDPANGPLLATFDRLESQCSELERLFSDGAASSDGSMSPETAATVEAALMVIRTALDESRDALRQNPDDEELARRVVDDYTDRLAFARRAARLAAPGDPDRPDDKSSVRPGDRPAGRPGDSPTGRPAEDT